MLAMALLLPGGQLGGVGGNARGVGGSGEGVLAPPTVPDGFRWGVETGELAEWACAVRTRHVPVPTRVQYPGWNECRAACRPRHDDGDDDGALPQGLVQARA